MALFGIALLGHSDSFLYQQEDCLMFGASVALQMIFGYIIIKDE